jgi:hypothetical protein
MKKIIIILFATGFLLSCGKGKSAKKIAEEICDCSKKANGLPATDTTRSKAQDDCTTLQTEGWEKVKKDPEKAKDFNDVLGKCASEQIKASFGQ